MKQRPVDRVPRDHGPEKPRPHVAHESDAKPLLVRLAEFAGHEIERQLSYTKQSVEEHRRGARHLPEAYRRLVARQIELQRLHDDVRAVVAPNQNPGLPDPAVISIIAQTVEWAIQRCGFENLSALVSARMLGYARLPPNETGKVLRALSALESLWKGDKR